MKHLLTMDELSKEEIEELLNRAAFFKKAKKNEIRKRSVRRQFVFRTKYKNTYKL
ncbi:hypothetical protein MCOL2_07536 [Listeria fleischmannii FSL S10-1203]|uniref:Uncharacterized protein n=1 Tax=Listeria fleischmannii FSL S10-1203 TaxID=1265822 RepID=W7DMV5_9LIST|nr:hypothetical protein MCOL2_07536 [Listeria fleischmannii FSL S10-1203]